MIASLALDATGATLTCGVTTPTTIRLLNDRTSIVEPIASFPAGRYTWTTILDGLTVKCTVAQDAIGVETPTLLTGNIGPSQGLPLPWMPRRP